MTQPIDNPNGIVFSDVDDTLIHKGEECYMDTGCRLAPETVAGIEQLAGVVPFAILTGSRYESFVKKTGGCIDAHYFLLENGGVIYSKNGVMVPDIKWNSHVQSHMDPVRAIAGEVTGYLDGVVGSGNYNAEYKEAMFLVGINEIPDDAVQMLRGINQPGVKIRFNNGHVEFFPDVAGKEVACGYVCEKYGLPLELAVMLGDGDNDRDVMQVVGHPITHEGGHPDIKKIVGAHPNGYISPNTGTRASIDMLAVTYDRMT